MSVAIAASLLLIVGGVFALRGGDDGSTAADGSLVPDQVLGADVLSTDVLAGPSGDNGNDGADRSAGAIAPVSDSDSDTEADGPDSTALEVQSSTTVDRTTTTPPPTTLPPTTIATSVTTTTEPGPTTTAEETTTVPTSGSSTSQVPTTKPATTTTTDQVITLPTIQKPDHAETRKALAAARKRWQSSGYDSYSMTVTRSCFCPSEFLGPFEVVVRNGRVQSVTAVDGEIDPRWVDAQSLTVPGLFATIDSAFSADRLRVEFDPNSGVPLVIDIDRLALAVDDELLITVSNFLPHRRR